jgi:pyruvate formate lyase activating enzyme
MNCSRREIIKGLAATAGISFLGFSNASAADYHKAKYWHFTGADVVCDLCPNGCVLSEGKTGSCRNRRNIGATLYTLGYANPCAVHVDPIEKKPLYHFYPGAKSFSVAIAGCNLRCKNCQNFEISQSSPLETRNIFLPPESVVDEAQKSNCPVIAFTYSEPSVWIEYMYDTAKLARKAGIKTVLVSNGFINNAPFEDLSAFIDGAHFDLKSFDDKIYHDLNGGSLSPVLSTLELARKKGLWIEIVNLVIPEWTDNLETIRKMCKWINAKLGTDTPVHFSRFFPLYQLSNLYPTPEEPLVKARSIALEEKLKYVYIGNMPDADSNTYCPNCRTLLVERKGYVISGYFLKQGKCGKCGSKIAGMWRS